MIGLTDRSRGSDIRRADNHNDEMRMSTDDRETYWQSLRSLEEWVIRNNYKAYDPFDGLSSFLRPLTLYRKLPQQVLQQFIRRNPLNLRPLLGIKPHTSTKGMGFLAGGYLKLYELTEDDSYRTKAVSCLQWLMDNSSRGYSGYCWGNEFDYISRGYYLRKHGPTIVWSGLIGHFFIEAYRVLRDPKYLDVASSVADFICKDLTRIPAPVGFCLSYVCNSDVAIHNSNLLGARLLAEVYKENPRDGYLTAATEAVRYSANAQLPNGAWYYGEEKKFHWIDNWHTAYNLDSLLDFQRNTGSAEFEPCMLRGLDFYITHFFREDGAPKYYWDREYKFDIQSSSQAIDTLLLFGAYLHRPELTQTAKRVAGWTIRNMQDESGYFYLWKNKWFTNRTPTFHWGATTMFHALSHLLLTMR